MLVPLEHIPAFQSTLSLSFQSLYFSSRLYLSVDTLPLHSTFFTSSPHPKSPAGLHVLHFSPSIFFQSVPSLTVHTLLFQSTPYSSSPHPFFPVYPFRPSSFNRSSQHSFLAVHTTRLPVTMASSTPTPYSVPSRPLHAFIRFIGGRKKVSREDRLGD